jgi:hypothetical protein
MSFTAEYLQRCYNTGKRGTGKVTKVGDWYIDLATGHFDVVSEGEETTIEFQSGRYIFVPDADDLLELIDCHVKAWGCDPNTKELTITYTPQKQWAVTIDYAKRLTYGGGRSVHEALLHAVWQMAVPIEIARRNLSPNNSTDNLGAANG